MSSPLTSVPPCPSFLAVSVADKYSKLAGVVTYLIDCGMTRGDHKEHCAANGRRWTDREGQTK